MHGGPHGYVGHGVGAVVTPLDPGAKGFVCSMAGCKNTYPTMTTLIRHQKLRHLPPRKHSRTVTFSRNDLHFELPFDITLPSRVLLPSARDARHWSHAPAHGILTRKSAESWAEATPEARARHPAGGCRGRSGRGSQPYPCAPTTSGTTTSGPPRGKATAKAPDDGAAAHRRAPGHGRGVGGRPHRPSSCPGPGRSRSRSRGRSCSRGVPCAPVGHARAAGAGVAGVSRGRGRGRGRGSGSGSGNGRIEGPPEFGGIRHSGRGGGKGGGRGRGR